MNGDRVERQHGDSVARSSAELAEHRVQAFEALEELAVRESGVATDERLAIASHTYRSTQRMDERVHAASIAHRLASRIARATRRVVTRTR